MQICQLSEPNPVQLFIKLVLEAEETNLLTVFGVVGLQSIETEEAKFLPPIFFQLFDYFW